MGLDITAYRQIRLIKVLIDLDDENFDWDTQTKIWPGLVEKHKHYPEHREGSDLKPGGVYEYAETFNFRAGSYSWYNRWREELSRLGMDVMPEIIWKNPDRYRDEPFYWLVNFSDCEGIIGAKVAGVLLAQFQRFDEQAKALNLRYFYEAYQKWAKAFELAADDGFVEFH